MLHVKILPVILLAFFLAAEAFSQPILIYSSGERTIQKAFKTSASDRKENLYISLSPLNSNSPESILKFNFGNYTMIDSPNYGALNSSCMWTQFGLECGSLIDVQSSRQDTNVFMFAKYAPWWEPAGDIAITENGGDTSRIMFSNGFIFEYQGMAFDPVNDSVIYVMWRYLDSANNFHKSVDRGRTWRGISQVYSPGSRIRVNPFNNSVIFVCNFSDILKSSDGGYTFQTLHDNTGGFREFVFDEEDSIIYFVTSNGLYRTDANGNNFQQISNQAFSTIKTDPLDGRIIYGGNSSGLYRSVDGGFHWSLYTNSFTPSTNVISIVKNPDMGNTLLVTTSKAVYRVQPEHPAASYFPMRVGNTWVYTYVEYFIPRNHKMSVVSETIIGSRRYFNLTGSIVPGSNIRIDSLTGSVYSYFPGCQNDEFLIDSLNARLGDSAIRCFGAPRVLAEYGAVNLFGWNTEGKSFAEDYLVINSIKYARGLGPYYQITSEPPPYSSHYTLRGCVIDGNVYGDTTLVSVSPVQVNAVQNFSLSQNYPNPFNPETKITFSIPERSATVLNVYDILGRMVATIVNETLDAGSYTVGFDATDLSGGVYYYRITSGQYEESRKMILAK